ncbi:hypothetical protein N8089_02460 [Flavobacteriales bacterium]|nr:hypothetical protein [Flavobacteriales bacterium]
MIAGETEYIIHGGEDNYDYFLKNLFKKNPNKQAKPKRTAEEKAARKEQRQQWWGKQKEGIQNAGGVDGITSTIGNIVGFFKKDNTPSDYDISMGGGQPAPQPEKKGVSKEVMIIGGIAVLVIAAYGFSVMQKNKKVQILSA